MQRRNARSINMGEFVEMWRNSDPDQGLVKGLVVGGPVEMPTIASGCLDEKVLVFRVFCDSGEIVYADHRALVSRYHANHEEQLRIDMSFQTKKAEEARRANG